MGLRRTTENDALRPACAEKQRIVTLDYSEGALPRTPASTMNGGEIRSIDSRDQAIKPRKRRFQRGSKLAPNVNSRVEHKSSYTNRREGQRGTWQILLDPMPFGRRLHQLRRTVKGMVGDLLRTHLPLLDVSSTRRRQGARSQVAYATSRSPIPRCMNCGFKAVCRSLM